MNYQFEFRCYQRTFKQPVQTNHGLWKQREGIIIRLEDATGNVGFGEVAPLPWFGSETLESAINFCRQQSHFIDQDAIFLIPDTLPACQFAFESALENLKHPTSPNFYPQHYSALLPAGQSALTTWEPLWQQGYRTFKWKIGVLPITEELEIFQQLIQQLPASVKLRLDANGGLNFETTKQWLAACDSIPILEFLEQPLPVDQFESMLSLTHQYSTPLALDESVATLTQLQHCYQQGWQGIFVIKPSIAGSPSRLQSFCKTHAIDAVFSSVFETRIGRNAALILASTLQNQFVKRVPFTPCEQPSRKSRPYLQAVTEKKNFCQDLASNQQGRALGFGIHHWFQEDAI